MPVRTAPAPAPVTGDDGIVDLCQKLMDLLKQLSDYLGEGDGDGTEAKAQALLARGKKYSALALLAERGEVLGLRYQARLQGGKARMAADTSWFKNLRGTTPATSRAAWFAKLPPPNPISAPAKTDWFKNVR